MPEVGHEVVRQVFVAPALLKLLGEIEAAVPVLAVEQILGERHGILVDLLRSVDRDRLADQIAWGRPAARLVALHAAGNQGGPGLPERDRSHQHSSWNPAKRS